VSCGSRELLGWRLSARGHVKTAEAALEEALVRRFGYLGRVPGELSLRSDNGLVFTSRYCTATVRAYGITQEFTTPYTPEQNGLVERFIRSLKEECIWQQRSSPWPMPKGPSASGSATTTPSGPTRPWATGLQPRLVRRRQ
jgi:putative transposase